MAACSSYVGIFPYHETVVAQERAASWAAQRSQALGDTYTEAQFLSLHLHFTLQAGVGRLNDKYWQQQFAAGLTDKPHETGLMRWMAMQSDFQNPLSGLNWTTADFGKLTLTATERDASSQFHLASANFWNSYVAWAEELTTVLATQVASQYPEQLKCS